MDEPAMHLGDLARRVETGRISLVPFGGDLSGSRRDWDIVAKDFGEIADRLGLPEGTVKSRINRGRTELARHLQALRQQQDAVPNTGVRG